MNLETYQTKVHNHSSQDSAIHNHSHFPDTIFLPDRAKLAMNPLIQCLNPKEDYLPYCLMDLTSKPPRMQHTQFDYSDHTSRVIDALLLSQAMTGSSDGDEQLKYLLKLFYSGFGEDGLHYTPDNPWSFRHANMHYQRSVINALISLILVKGSEQAVDKARGLLKGLADISIKREGFWYFPSVEYLPDGWPRGDWDILSYGVDPANTNGRMLFGLTRLHEILGDSNAADLAYNYAQHVMHHSSAFHPDGSFATGMEFREGHFHSRAVTMLGVIRYGYGFGDASATEWGKRVFDRALQYGTSFGWYPERVVKSRAHGCETCAVVDMMEAAIWLAKSGYPQYWEEAERILRNQLLESQLTNVDWLQDFDKEVAKNPWETTVNVVRRSQGGFAGWSLPNDFLSNVMHGWDLYTCCCAQGARGLFNAWAEAVSFKDNKISVNLLINHIGEHANVRSWMPHEGHVQVVPQQDYEVQLRVPSWVDPREISLTVGGEPASFTFANKNYIRTKVIPAGVPVDFYFPMEETTRTDSALDNTYTTSWRGDTVINITPSGVNSPLYKRSHLDQVPIVEKHVNPINIHL